MALEKLHRMPLDTLMIINCDLFSPVTARAGPAIGTYRLDNHMAMCSVGHSRLHELLPGSTTDRVPHRSPFPLLVAH